MIKKLFGFFIYHKAWFAVDKRNYKNWRKNEKAIGLN